MDTKQIAKDMKQVFEKSLPFKIPNFTQRLRITADVEKYKWKEDESVWNQKKDRAANNFEVLFDGEFVCFFDLLETEQQVVLKMLEGLRSLFSEQKIFIHPSMYEVRKAQLEAESIVTVDKPSTEGEAILTEVLKKQVKRKGKKLVLKERKPDVIN